MENILSAMRNNFCQKNSALESNKVNDVLTQIRTSSGDKSAPEPVKKVGKQSGKSNKSDKKGRKQSENRSKQNDTLDKMRSSFCDKSTSEPFKSKTAGKKSGNSSKQNDMPDLMIEIKEEPISDDENDKNENEETTTISHTICLEEPTKMQAIINSTNNLRNFKSPLISTNFIKKEVISLIMEEEKETTQFIHQIKQENKDGDHKEMQTKSDINNMRTDKSAENILAAMRNNFCKKKSSSESKKVGDVLAHKIKQETKNRDEEDVQTKSVINNMRTDIGVEQLPVDIIKKEELIVAWTDNQPESSTSNGPSDYTDEMLSVFQYENEEGPSSVISAKFETTQEEGENIGMFEAYKHFLESGNSGDEQNEDDYGEDDDESNNDSNDDDNIDEDREGGSVYFDDSDYEENKYDDDDDDDDGKRGRKRMDAVTGKQEMRIISDHYRSLLKSDPLDKWCCKIRGKACFLCFNDERYQTKESFLQHIRENHCQVKVVGYRLKPVYGQEKLKKVFYMVDSSQDGFGLCIECYMVFYTAERATNHMIGHIKTHDFNIPRFNKFRSCCRANTTVCVQPFIICGECRCPLRRSDSTLTRHGSLHYKEPVSGVTLPQEERKSDLFLSPSVRSKNVSKVKQSENMTFLFSPQDNNKNYEKCEIENDIKIDNNVSGSGEGGSSSVIADIDEEEFDKSIKGKDMKDVLSAMQTKFCKAPEFDVKRIKKKYVNNVLSEMQQTFCSANESSENSVSSETELSFEDSSVRKYVWQKDINSPRWKNLINWKKDSYSPQWKNLKLMKVIKDIDVIEEMGKENESYNEESQTEFMKSVTNNSLKVVLKRVEWDGKSEEQRMQFLKDDEKRHKDRNSKKRKINETVRESDVDDKEDVIVDVESSKSKLQKVDHPTRKFQDDIEGSYNEIESSSKCVKHDLSKQINEKSGDDFFYQEFFIWENLSRDTKKLFVAEKHMGGLFLHTLAKVKIMDRYFSGTQLIDVCRQAGVNYYTAKFWITKVLNSIQEWVNKEQEDMETEKTSPDNSSSLQEPFVWNKLTIDQKKHLVSTAQAGSLYLDELSRIDVIDKYMSGSTILELSRQTGCYYCPVRTWIKKVINDISTPDQEDNKTDGGYKRVKKLRTIHRRQRNGKLIDYRKSVPVPEGWKRRVVMGPGRESQGKVEVYYISPDGKKLRSVEEVEEYCKAEGIEIDLSLFTFTYEGWYRKTLEESASPSMTKMPKNPKIIKMPKTSKIIKDGDKPKKKRGPPKGSTKARRKMDPNEEVIVPEGWRRLVVKKAGDPSAANSDVYFFSPEGKRFRSKIAVETYCLKQGIEIDSKFLSLRDFTESCNKTQTSETSKDGETPNENQGERLDITEISSNLNRTNVTISENKGASTSTQGIDVRLSNAVSSNSVVAASETIESEVPTDEENTNKLNQPDDSSKGDDPRT